MDKPDRFDYDNTDLHVLAQDITRCPHPNPNMSIHPLKLARNLVANTASYAIGPKGQSYKNFFGPNGYRTPEDIENELTRMMATAPNSVTVHALEPRTVEGRRIRVARVRQPGLPPNAPRVLLTSLLHSREFIGAEVSLEVLWDMIKTRRPKAASLMARCEVDVVVIANPDGVDRNVRRIRDRGWRFGTLRRGNARGVDLNRNFGRHYSNRARTYRWRISDEFAGPGPFSEPESRALKSLALARRYDASISLHSYSSVFLVPPFGGQGADPIVEAIAQKLPALQTLEPYEVVRGSLFYKQRPWMALLFEMLRGTDTVNGTFDDWLSAQGVRPLLIEIAKPGPRLAEHLGEMAISHLRAFNPSPQDRAAAVENVLAPIFAYYHGVLDAIETPREAKQR